MVLQPVGAGDQHARVDAQVGVVQGHQPPSLHLGRPPQRPQRVRFQGAWVEGPAVGAPMAGCREQHVVLGISRLGARGRADVDRGQRSGVKIVAGRREDRHGWDEPGGADGEAGVQERRAAAQQELTTIGVGDVEPAGEIGQEVQAGGAHSPTPRLGVVD